MNIQEVLENYNIYKARISIAEGEVVDLKNEIKDIKAVQLDGMPKAKNLVTSNVENAIVEKEEKVEKKQRYINELKFKITIVENLVKTLKKYNQDIIEMRFYNMMNIEEIAVRKDRSYRTIQETIRQSINKMQREFDKNAKIV